jgi:hypothetical protein
MKRRWPWNDLLKDIRERRANARRRSDALRLLEQFPRNGDAPRHDLPGKLIVSLTSYPGRFNTLHLTIKSVLDQSVKPDQIILWVDKASIGLLPAAVKELEGGLFTCRVCEDDLRSFNKIIPTLLAHPDAFIAIADDDIYYPDFWLERLIAAYDPKEPTIVYHRGHRIAYRPDGRLAPYSSWTRGVRDEDSLEPGTDVFPTGVGGVLYPPGSLPAIATDAGLLRQLSATCDDSWLYFMWRQTPWKAKRVPGRMPRFVEWPNTQQSSLQAFHADGAKDEHLQALSDYFGTP